MQKKELVYEYDAEGRCYAVAFAPDGETLAVGADNNMISLLDAKTGEVRSHITGHTDYVRALLYTLDGQKLLSGSKDGQLYFFDVETGQPLMRIERVGWTTCIVQSQDGLQFLTCSQTKSSGPVRNINIFNIFNDRNSEMVMTLNLGASINCCQFSPCGEYIACGTKNKTVSIFDITRFKCVAEMKKHSKSVTGVAVAPCGMFASTSEDGKLILFEKSDASVGREALTFNPFTTTPPPPNRS